MFYHEFCKRKVCSVWEHVNSVWEHPRYREERITYFCLASLHPWDPNLLCMFHRQEAFPPASREQARECRRKTPMTVWLLGLMRGVRQHCLASVGSLPKTHLWPSGKVLRTSLSLGLEGIWWVFGDKTPPVDQVQVLLASPSSGPGVKDSSRRGH